MANPNLDQLKLIPASLNKALADILGSMTSYAERTPHPGQIQSVIYPLSLTPSNQMVRFHLRVEAGYGSLVDANAGCMELFSILADADKPLVRNANAIAAQAVTNACPITGLNLEDTQLKSVIIAPTQKIENLQAACWVVIITTDNLEAKTGFRWVCL
jgi:hypothetical protein